jgi:hypothetical protein
MIPAGFDLRPVESGARVRAHMSTARAEFIIDIGGVSTWHLLRLAAVSLRMRAAGAVRRRFGSYERAWEQA